MSIVKNTLLLTAAIGIAASVALAGGHSASPESKAIKARQAQMILYSFNLSILGAMAKGEQDYDAGAAGLAATNLASLASVHMPGAWLPGTDNEQMKGTAALPKMWQDAPEEVGAKAQALSKAIPDLVKAAGTDLAALRGAIGPVGQACGSCHKAYRAKN